LRENQQQSRLRELIYYFENNLQTFDDLFILTNKSFFTIYLLRTKQLFGLLALLMAPVNEERLKLFKLLRFKYKKNTHGP